MPRSRASNSTAQIAEIVQRLFMLRHRFRVGLPETLLALKKRVHLDAEATSVGFSTDLDLFFTIGVAFARRDEPMTMGEFSRALDVPLSSATRIADWLVDRGYARRLADADDRRVVRMTLTEAGAALHQEIERVFLQRVDHLMRSFSHQERSTFLRLMDKLVSTLEEEVRLTTTPKR